MGTCDDRITRSSPGALLTTIRRLPDLPGWHRVAALALACLLVTAVLPVTLDRHPGRHFVDQWLVAYGSWYATLPLVLAALLPGWTGRVAFALLLSALTLGLAWHIASVTLYADQVRTLLWEELWFRCTDRLSRPFLIESLTAPGSIAFLLGCPALVVAVAWGLRRYAARACCHLALGAWILAAGSTVALVGTGIAGGSGYLARVQMPLAAPWVVYRLSNGLAFDPTRAEDGADAIAGAALGRTGEGSEAYRMDGPDVAAARAFRDAAQDPELAPGAEPLLAGLAGRYRDRAIIAIFLESHRLSDVDGIGQGACFHHPASPYLAAALSKGIWFAHFVQTGPSTLYNHFSYASGLPCPRGIGVLGTDRAIQLGTLGRWPGFIAAGYRCEWAMATDPHFGRWSDLCTAVQVPCWLGPEETAGRDHRWWTSWGMPDEQMLDVLWQRYTRRCGDGRRYFITVPTVSNHQPFIFPPPAEGGSYARDHIGGMLYSDACLEGFLRRIASLPEAQRPIVWIAADHSHGHGLGSALPLGTANPEGFRIPAVLLLPDSHLAGTRCDALLNHQDSLDLLWSLVSEAHVARFSAYHRRYAAIATGLEPSIITASTLWDGPTASAWRCRGLWGLEPLDDAADLAELQHCRREHADAYRRMWPPAEAAAAISR
jgi:hypothetical protein